MLTTKDRDINEASNYMDSLLKQVNILETLLEVIPVSMVILDSNGRIQKANKEFFAYDYKELTEKDIIRQPYRKIIGYTKEKYQKTALYQALQGKKITKVHVKGGNHDWLVSALPIKDERGQVLGAVGFYVNMTDYYMLIKKVIEAQNEIDDKNKKMADILESIADGFFALDNDWNFIYINNEATKILSKKEKDLLGFNIWDKLSKNPVYYDNYHQAKELNQPVHFQTFCEASKIWLQVSAYPSPDGLGVYFKDITAQREQEEREKQLTIQYLNEKEKLNQLIELLPIGIIAIDQEENVEIINRTLLDLIPQSKKKNIIGRSYRSIINYLSLDYENLGVVKALRGLKGNEKHIKILERDWLYRSVPIRDFENKTILGAVEIFDDITEYEKTKAELIKLDRLNVIGQMAAGVAHEIRNPLTTIRGFLQLLSRKDECTELRSYYDTMIEELDRCNSIITEFLSIANNDSVKLKKNNINKIINAILPLIQADALADDKAVTFIPNYVPDLNLDAKGIRQLILNFVRNGLEAMSSGGEVTIRTYLEKGQVVLSIEDQGSGIQEEVFNKLGTPFFTTKENGVGLGLATSYNIARRNNAEIEALTSAKGTAFLVKFRVDSEYR